MLDVKQGNQVALFIDWDNLAISTAADLGGATPDLERIVQKAREHGTIVLARAYAEWSALAERLTVYKAGVEPIYAPTFRFDNDPVTQAPRGKSLADPVMVTDCIDCLHLLPTITTFVIVTGDKDLIPVVRLAKLRGKRVVVIGPDYVAVVLREMADEFVSYRSLIDTDIPAPEPRRRGSRDRRSATGPVVVTSAAPVAALPVPTRPVEPPVPAARPAEPSRRGRDRDRDRDRDRERDQDRGRDRDR
ncbi:MAG: NYN domain-containing protein, partial [Chloroflexi bacterium]|nr:NYN domain-containing protein [Chloroflexota bacterium]